MGNNYDSDCIAVAEEFLYKVLASKDQDCDGAIFFNSEQNVKNINPIARQLTYHKEHKNLVDIARGFAMRKDWSSCGWSDKGAMWVNFINFVSRNYPHYLGENDTTKYAQRLIQILTEIGTMNDVVAEAALGFYNSRICALVNGNKSIINEKYFRTFLNKYLDYIVLSVNLALATTLHDYGQLESKTIKIDNITEAKSWLDSIERKLDIIIKEENSDSTYQVQDYQDLKNVEGMIFADKIKTRSEWWTVYRAFIKNVKPLL